MKDQTCISVMIRKPAPTHPKRRRWLSCIQILACALFFLPFVEVERGYAQNNNVGIGTLTPQPSAILDVTATDKGLLIPRITDTNNVVSPATGLLIYLIPTNNFYYFNGNFWKSIISGTHWTLTGNAGTVDGTNFIGTTDSIPFNIKVNNQKAGRIDLDPVKGNTFFGYQAGNVNTSGVENTAIGFRALSSNTTGYFNTANGMYALASNTTGFLNTANGAYALASNTTGAGNTANGFWALEFNTTGDENTANGLRALLYNTTGIQNTGIGSQALMWNTTGSGNTVNGFDALLNNITGD